MTDRTLADLTEDASPDSEDLVYVVSNPSGTPADRKVTLSNAVAAGMPAYASQAEAEAGTATDKLMTPLRAKQGTFATLPYYFVSDARNGTLQGAIDRASAAGGGMVILDKAEAVSSTITLATSVAVRGMPGATLSWAGAAGGTLFQSDPTDVLYYAGVDGLTINADNLSTVFDLHSTQFSNFHNIRATGGDASHDFLKFVADSSAGTGPTGTANVSFNDIRNILHVGICGRLIVLSGTDSSHVCTLNAVHHSYAKNVQVIGYDFPKWCDNNTFSGMNRVAIVGDNAIGMVQNSDTPASEMGVYANIFQYLAVDSFATYTGRVGVQINKSKSTKIDFLHQEPVAEGGDLVDGGADSYIVNVMHGTSLQTYQKKWDFVADSFSSTVELITLADDEATSIDAPKDAGRFTITGNGNSSGVVFFRCSAPAAVKLEGNATFFEVTTGALAGTTGTDARFTVSAHTDGNIYVENRTGASISFRYTFSDMKD